MVRESCRDTCSTSLDDAIAKYVAAACPPSSEIETAGWRRKYLQKLRFLTSDDDEDDDCTGEDDDGWMEDTWNDDIFTKRAVKRSVDADVNLEAATETVISNDEVVAESSSSGNAGPEIRLHADAPSNVNGAQPSAPGDDEDEDCDGPEEEEEEDDDDDYDDCDNGDDSDDGSRYHKYIPAGYQYPPQTAVYPPPIAAEYPPSMAPPSAPPSGPPSVPPAAPALPAQPPHPSVETIGIPREAISIYEPMSQSDKYMKTARDEKIWDNSVEAAQGMMQSSGKHPVAEGQTDEANVAARDADGDDHTSLRAKLANVADQSPAIQARLASLLNFPLPVADKLFCQRQKGGSLCWIPDFGGDDSDECGESGGCENESSSSWKDKFNFCKGGFCFGFNKDNGKDSESDSCSGDSCGDGRPDPCSGDECSGEREHENPEPLPECHPTDTSCNGLMTGGPKRPTPTNVYGPDRHHEEPYPGPPRYTRPPSNSIFECPESGDCEGHLYEECSGSACRNLLQSPPENLIKTTAIPVSDVEKDVENDVSGPEDPIKESPLTADSDNGSKADDSTKSNDIADQAIGVMDETKDDNKDSDTPSKSEESIKETMTEPARKAQETKAPGSEDKMRAKLDSRMDKLKKNVKDAAGIADNKFKKVVGAYNSTNQSSTVNWTTTGNYSAVKMQSAGAQLLTPVYEIVLATLLSVVSYILFL